MKSYFVNSMSDPVQVRWELSKKYIIGKGLELGALQNPLRISEGVRVLYVDKIDSKTALTVHYPELEGNKLVDVDILEDAEKLSCFPSDSQDFIIANHFLEHTQNPIGAISAHLSKLKNGGILYYAVPDKRRTFDVNRTLTSFEHILQDYENGPSSSYEQHLKEWVEHVEKKPREQSDYRIKELRAMNYAIHFHVWDAESFRKFLDKANELLGFPFAIVEYIENNDNENIAILRKIKSEIKPNENSNLEKKVVNQPIDQSDVQTLAVQSLLQVYERRKDLQLAFPEIKKGMGMTSLICWAKKFGIHEEDTLLPYASYYVENCTTY